MKRTYMIYDGRAGSEDTDSALVLSVCDTLSEAKEEVRRLGDAVIYSYAEGEDGELVDECMEGK